MTDLSKGDLVRVDRLPNETPRLAIFLGGDDELRHTCWVYIPSLDCYKKTRRIGWRRVELVQKR